ncbi:MAG: von Willebrand factor type A domain-containing protein [Chitinophagaceae bacterium]|nr:von Willebrand factor type A domain-containing protein [Chitinophagaceae bacterium]
MKRVSWVFLLLLFAHGLYGQYYLRGEVRDNRGRPLEGVKINLASHGAFPYYSGSGGTFGITVSLASDTITLSLEGYEQWKAAVDTRQFQSLVLKMLPSTAQQYHNKLTSATTNLKAESAGGAAVPGESYTNLVENQFVDAAVYPETGFSINVDKAAYSNIRRFLINEMKVPKDAIRIEEMLNYFSFTRAAGEANTRQFHCQSELTGCPWKTDNRLLFLNITAPRLNLDNLPPSNLVFLIDISGSMDKPNRLPLLQAGFKLLVDNLRAKDTLSIVTYGGGVGIALQPTGGNNKQHIKAVIDSLVAGGDTPGEGAIRTAYNLAKKTLIHDGNNRVILATDGDFNVGQVSETELEDMITGYRQTGIYLTCLGVGMGNYKDSKLETLSKKGNGNFAYIDNLEEAQKVLVTEFTQTLYAVANNASVKIDFDPRIVKAYRLIGFDNKKNAIQDTTSELEGGEVGSGHSMLAIFELEPAGRDSLFRHQEFAQLLLQYRITSTDLPAKQHFSIPYNPLPIEKADSSYRFAAAIALFGSVLKQSRFVKDLAFEDVRELARTSVNINDARQSEFLVLIEKAIKVYTPGKKKNR